MNPHDLIEVARALAESGHVQPMQARLRRAVGTALVPMDRLMDEEGNEWAR